MDARVVEFRKLARAFGAGKGPRPAPYPAQCRALAVEYARDRLLEGEGIQDVSDTLGVARQTLDKWRRQPIKAIRPVVVSKPKPKAEVEARPSPKPRRKPKGKPGPGGQTAPPSGPAIVMPSGVRVEGLDVAGVIAVLKELG